MDRILCDQIRSLSSLLDAYAARNWRLPSTSRKSWNFPRELAVVTGGSSGIGLVTSRLLAARGLTVIILDVQEPPSSLLSDYRVHFYNCDITSSSAVTSTASTIKQTHGPPSILINNAGIGGAHGILDTSEAYLHKIFAVNLFSHYLTVQAFLPEMLARDKGHIVTIASTASFITIPTIVDYNATKAGALSFHEGLTAEIRALHKKKGVLTSVVHPHWTLTNMTKGWKEKIEYSEGGMMTPEAVAERVVEQVMGCKGGRVVLPEYMAWLANLRSWAGWRQEILRDAVGKGVIARDP
ncbi:MAG: hypothetical protein Q9227_009325 [Pyrenula ochraceoflavens]